jgi:hypothetical protein
MKYADDDAALSVGVSASLGEISVQIRPVIITEYNDRKSRRKDVSLVPGIIHERSKKAGAHSVQCVDLFCFRLSPDNRTQTRPLGGSRITR